MNLEIETTRRLVAIGEVDEAPRSFYAASLCYFATPPPLSSKSSLSRGIKKVKYDVTN